MKFYIEDFFSKCDQIRSFLWIWSHLLKKSLMENFIFRAVNRVLLQRRILKRILEEKRSEACSGPIQTSRMNYFCKNKI